MSKKIIVILSLLLSFLLLSTPAGACETGHHIKEIIDHGKILKLEDDTLWQIGAPDQTEVANWKNGENITTCDYSIINTSESKTVTAFQLH